MIPASRRVAALIGIFALMLVVLTLPAIAQTTRASIKRWPRI